MKFAIPVWQGRISPVFDVAGQLLLVELANGREVARHEQMVDETTADERVRRLVELGVRNADLRRHLAVVGNWFG